MKTPNRQQRVKSLSLAIFTVHYFSRGMHLLSSWHCNSWRHGIITEHKHTQKYEPDTATCSHAGYTLLQGWTIWKIIDNINHSGTWASSIANIYATLLTLTSFFQFYRLVKWYQMVEALRWICQLFYITCNKGPQSPDEWHNRTYIFHSLSVCACVFILAAEPAGLTC